MLNPQSGYIKIDAYLLQILYHMIFDGKLSHCFLLSKVKNVFLTFRYVFLACRKTSTVKYTLNCFNFQFSFVYHEVWIVILVDSTTNIFLWKSRLQLYCHKVEAANAILSVVKNNWNGSFSDFIDLQGKKIGLAHLVQFYLSCWLYTLQLFIVGNFWSVFINQK